MILRSIRLRLTLMSATMIGLALFVTGQSSSYIFERHLKIRLERELEDRWLELAAAVKIGPQQAVELAAPLSDSRYEKPYGGAYWRITEGGVSIMRSRSLWDQDISRAPILHKSPGNAAIEAIGPNQSVLYMIRREVVVRSADLTLQGPARKLGLAVALDYGEIDAERAAFEKDLVRALLAIAAVLVFGSWMQTSFGLRPLGQLRRQLALIHRSVATRLTGPFPNEVEPLALDVNRLLERQDALVQKARGRAGDLAHGLKTPLTILLGEAERLERAGSEQTALALREQVGLMLGHIERELARARTHGISATGGGQTDPGRTLDRLISLVARMPRGDSLIFHNNVEAGLRLQMDPDDFGEVMGNLLDNGRKHARQTVKVMSRSMAGSVEIIVADDGPGIPEGIRDRILQRGERGLATGEGAGLGLSIVQDILAEYETSIRIGDEPSGGCRLSFHVRSVMF